MRLIMWTIILGGIGCKLVFEPLSETHGMALSSLAGIGGHGRVAGG